MTYTSKSLAGIITFLMGLFCLIIPAVGTFDVQGLLGAFFITVAVFSLVAVFDNLKTGYYHWNAVRAAAILLTGLFLAADTSTNSGGLGAALFAFFGISGVVTLLIAYTQKDVGNAKWYWSFFTGSLGLCFALIMYLQFPFAQDWSVLTLVSVYLISQGTATLLTSETIGQEDIDGVTATTKKTLVF